MKGLVVLKWFQIRKGGLNTGMYKDFTDVEIGDMIASNQPVRTNTLIQVKNQPFTSLTRTR